MKTVFRILLASLMALLLVITGGPSGAYAFGPSASQPAAPLAVQTATPIYLPLIDLRYPDIAATYDATRAKAHAVALADLGPRVAGSDAESAAADYIVAEFESYGYPVEVESFALDGGGTSAVVVATLEGRQEGAGIMYIGAHYDSKPGSPGGNDNGSGLGSLLEIARVMEGLVRNPPLTIKFWRLAPKRSACWVPTIT